MKYKNIKVINVIDFLNKFGDMKLPVKISFAIIKNQNHFNKEYQVYIEALKKIYDAYSDNFAKDDKGNVTVDKNGLPIIEDKEIYKKLQDEIAELLSMEVEVERFYIDESTFDYDDSKYDVLTPKDMFSLMDFLCRKDEDKTE